MELFRTTTKVVIGDGVWGSFWYDRWLDGCSPKDIAPSLFFPFETQAFVHFRIIAWQDLFETSLPLLGFMTFSPLGVLSNRAFGPRHAGLHLLDGLG